MGTTVSDVWSDDFVIYNSAPNIEFNDGWHIYSDSTFVTPPNVTYADNNTYLGPFSLQITAQADRDTIKIERWFECDTSVVGDEFELSFDYCNCGMESSDTFSLDYIGFDQALTDNLWIQVFSMEALTTQDITTLSSNDQTALRNKDECNDQATWRCKTMTSQMVLPLPPLIMVSFRASVDYKTDTFALRNVEVSVKHKSYDVFTSEANDPDPNNYFIFGFKTYGGDIYNEAPKAKIILDLYDNNGNIYRCHYLRAGTNTEYHCRYGIDDHVLKLSTNSNPNNYKTTLLLRVFELDELWIESIYISTTNDIEKFENRAMLEVSKLDNGDDIKLSKTQSSVRFVFDTSCSGPDFPNVCADFPSTYRRSTFP